MAINKWLGTATTAVQVDTFTPASITIGDVFTMTVSGFDGTQSSIEYTAVDTSAATVSGALIGLWQAETTDPLFTGVTASGTATVILTANVAGTAFKVASSATGASPTFTRAATITNGGPNDWADPNNWSEGTIPGATASEDTFVEDSTIDILYGLDQSGAANTLTKLVIKKTYTGKIGWNGATGVIGDYLQVNTSKAFIGEPFDPGSAGGSSRLKFNFGTVACDIIVYFTANSSDAGKNACRIIANNAATEIKEIRKGSVGVAAITGETATVGDILISFDTAVGSDAQLTIGNGVTMGDLTCVGGDTFLKTSATTVESRAGTLTISGTGTVATLTANGGAIRPVSSGTITTCNITGGTVDFTASAEARTVTTLTLTQGLLQYEKEVVTITSKIEPADNAGRVQLRASRI